MLCQQWRRKRRYHLFSARVFLSCSDVAFPQWNAAATFRIIIFNYSSTKSSILNPLNLEWNTQFPIPANRNRWEWLQLSSASRFVLRNIRWANFSFLCSFMAAIGLFFNFQLSFTPMLKSFVFKFSWHVRNQLSFNLELKSRSAFAQKYFVWSTHLKSWEFVWVKLGKPDLKVIPCIDLQLFTINWFNYM